MGMFDQINIPIRCPFCHQITQDGQTKDLGNTLRAWQLGDDTKTKFEFLNCTYECSSKECEKFAKEKASYTFSGFGRILTVKIYLEKGIITNKYKILTIKYLKCSCGWQSKAYSIDHLFVGLGGTLSCPECTKLKRNPTLEGLYGHVRIIEDEESYNPSKRSC